jgi:esterase/lipase superfamily enzyme
MAWKKIAAGEEAIIFVHGYNTSFNDAVFRTAQIIWDLQYRGTAVLFSWPSRGETLSYEYDRNSALTARGHFIELLKLLEQEVGIKSVHVIAHSMGNLVVLDALANHIRTGDPLAIGQLIMAAPDVDRDQYRQVVKSVGRIVGGMTLYASAADKAMLASRTLAQGPRAGDVLGGLPTIVEGVDAIDVTAVGNEILGTDHDTFASKRSLINDIGLVLQGKRPPNSRLAEIRGMPEGAAKPSFWRYAP